MTKLFKNGQSQVIRLLSCVEWTNQMFCQWLLILLISLYVTPALAGDFIIEGGVTHPLIRPQGKFVKSLDLENEATAGRIGLWYIFDSGLTVGRATYSAAYRLKGQNTVGTVSTKDTHLVITPGYYTLGWAFGESIRLILGIGLPEKALVSVREKLFEGESEGRQRVDSRGGGLLLDLGDDGVGILISLQYDTLSTSNLFDTGKDFEFKGGTFGISLRYLL